MEDKNDEKSESKLLKQLYYLENKDRIVNYNLNRYYMHRYGKTREEVRLEKETNRKKKIELHLNKLK